MLALTPDSDLASHVGRALGTSDWYEIEQARIDAFAEATGDHQWLHVDVARAAAGPYGSTIAHGFLLLALLPTMSATAVEIVGFGAAVNYGLNRVRFPAPARSGAVIRDVMTLDAVDEVSGGTLLTITHTIEVRGQDRPACVAQQLRLLTR
jgi:acyl dehydratase